MNDYSRVLLSLLVCTATSAQADIQLTPKLSGLEGKPAQNANASLTDAIQNLPKPLDESQAKNFYTYSDDMISSAISPYGYFDPTIKKTLIAKNAQWQLDYQVDPGHLTRITAIQIQLTGEGANENQLTFIAEHPSFQIGDAFASERYEHYKTKLLDEAHALGYVKANFTEHKILVNKKNRTAQIHLTLDTGPLYYFGEVHFNPNPLRDSFLQRFLSFSRGQPYSSEKVSQLQNDLMDSGYFKSVSVRADEDNAGPDNTIPINAKVRPAPKQQYILGGGYGTDTGPRATLGSDWRYVNSYGHRFNTLLRLSQVQNTASAKYIIPGKHPLSDQYNLNASLQTNNINQGNSTVHQVGGGYMLTRGQWQRSFNLNYQVERYNFFNGPYQTSHLLLPGITLQNTASNDPLFPTEGHKINLSIIAAKEGFASNTSLVQGRASAKWIHSLNKRNIILLRGDFGYTSIHDLSLLPLSLSYFAGGSQSIRGYGYNTLGPGRYLTVASAEYRYRVIPKWYATTFLDIGNAYNNFPSGSNSSYGSKLGALYNSLNRGAGFGVVWASPVGPMQLTFAQQITTRTKPNRIQFNMGTDL